MVSKGILWVLYASVRALFKHSYFEIAYGASVLWIIFVIGIAFVSDEQELYDIAAERS